MTSQEQLREEWEQDILCGAVPSKATISGKEVVHDPYYLIGLIRTLLTLARKEEREKVYQKFMPFLAKYSLDRPIPPAELRYFLENLFLTHE